MSIAPGQTIAHYRLVEKIGEGGMGVVWKAVDTTLDREVAIKVLPDVFSEDVDRLGRFEREAKLLASLNHPNIASVYSVHFEEGKRFLAMELVRGEDLSHRLARGPIPVDEALQIGLQIAEALETAHENGVVHRDLKPANILVSEDGSAKVLDFGLAKALSPEAPASGTSPAMSPTLTSAGTVAGMIIGTASYMSPEQAKGKAVDRRADVWAFGVVLAEMLTGRQLFTGETVSETLAAVLLREADLGDLPGDTPPAARGLLERCLAKDPKLRLQDIGEARIALARPDASTLGSIVAAPAVEPVPVWKKLAPWAVAGLLAIVAGISLVSWAPWQAGPEAPRPVQLRVELTPETELFTDYGAATVLTPDGDKLIFVSGGITGRTVFIRDMERLEPKAVTGSDEGYHPFVSPDGQWVGFVTREKLKKVSAFGGTPIDLADVSLSRGGTWGPDDTIIYTPSPNSGLMRISAEGGGPEPLTVLDESKEEVTHRWPQYLPGGKAVLLTVHTSGAGFDDARIEVLDLETKERKILHRGGSYARYVPTGHLAFVRENTLYVMPFDLDSLEVTGSHVPVLEGITANPAHGSAQYDFSADGTLVYSEGVSAMRVAKIIEHRRDGAASPIVPETGEFFDPKFSPDGKLLAHYSGAFDDADIWISDLERGTRTRLTFSDKVDWAPVWSPDGRAITFSSGRDGIANIYRKPSDGSAEPERLTESPHVQTPHSWSPDGRYLAYSELSSDGGWNILIYDNESGESTPFLTTRFNEIGAVFTVEGRWLAYTSIESGRYEVYVRPFPGPGGKWQISTAGGMTPRASRDGSEIFYVSLEGKLMAVPISSEGDRFVAGNPVEVLDAGGYLGDFFGAYDVGPDSDRFAFIESGDTDEGAPDRSNVNLIMNWFGEVERMTAAAAR